MSLTSRRTVMARKRYKPEEIVAKLRQIDVLVSQGQNMVDAIRQIGVSEVTYYRWRQEFGGLKIEQVKRLKDLELENSRLRKAVSDLTLELLCLLRGTDEHLPALGIPLSHQHEMVPKSATTQSAAPADVETDDSAHCPVPAVPVRAAPVAGSAVRRHILEVGAECVSSACSDLCGGWSAMTIPTAIKPIPGCRRCFERGRQHVSDAPSQGPNGPAWSKNLACAEAPWTGTGRSHVWPAAVRCSSPHREGEEP